MRRLLALIVLAVVGFFLFSYWKNNQGTLHAPNAAGVSQTLDTVGGKLRSTRTTGSVKAAFELNRALAGAPIDVDADGDVVILKGEVPTPETRTLAESVAAGVPGVVQVRNELRVNAALPVGPGESRTLGENVDDRAMEGKVRLAYSLNREMAGSDISVASYRRAVTLTGQAASEPQRQAALQMAREIPGVVSVVDQIQVRGGGAVPQQQGIPAASPGAGQAVVPMQGSPEPLTVPGAAEQAIARVLGANASLSAYGLKVRNDGGRLVLTGNVRTAAERELAGLLARDAARSDVANAVEIRP